MLGGAYGFLKLIFHSETLKLLGVHAFGEGSTEIIHIGQVVLSQGGSVKYFQTAVFKWVNHTCICLYITTRSFFND